MKISITALSLSALLAAAAAGAQVPVVGGPRGTPAQVQSTLDGIKGQLGSGSEYTAALASSEFLTLLFDVPSEKIAVKVIQSQGNLATVQATMPARACDLSLMKNANANKYGWVVQTHACRRI